MCACLPVSHLPDDWEMPPIAMLGEDELSGLDLTSGLVSGVALSKRSRCMLHENRKAVGRTSHTHTPSYGRQWEGPLTHTHQAMDGNAEGAIAERELIESCQERSDSGGACRFVCRFERSDDERQVGQPVKLRLVTPCSAAGPVKPPLACGS